MSSEKLDFRKASGIYLISYRYDPLIYYIGRFIQSLKTSVWVYDAKSLNLVLNASSFTEVQKELHISRRSVANYINTDKAYSIKNKFYYFFSNPLTEKDVKFYLTKVSNLNTIKISPQFIWAYDAINFTMINNKPFTSHQKLADSLKRLSVNRINTYKSTTIKGKKVFLFTHELTIKELDNLKNSTPT